MVNVSLRCGSSPSCIYYMHAAGARSRRAGAWYAPAEADPRSPHAISEKVSCRSCVFAKMVGGGPAACLVLAFSQANEAAERFEQEVFGERSSSNTVWKHSVPLVGS